MGTASILLKQIERHQALERKKKTIGQNIKDIAAKMNNEEANIFFRHLQLTNPERNLVDSCLHMLYDADCLSHFFDTLHANENIEPKIKKIVQFVRREYYASRAHERR